MRAAGRRGIGLVVALPEEIKPLAARLGLRRHTTGVWRGSYGSREVVALLAGLGPARASEAAERLVSHHHCGGLLTLGFAGGLSPHLAVGDVVVIETSRAQDETLVPASHEWVEVVRHAADGVGSCLTMMVPVRSREEKAALWELTGAEVVDMETSAVAAVAQRLAVPWLGLRAVSDAAEDAIPRVVHERIDTERGRIDTPGMVLHVLPRPGHWPELIALARRSRRAARRLTAVAAAFLERLA